MASSAYDYALGLLSARPYAARTLRRKLTLKGYEAPEVHRALARLEAAGLIDDAKFAEQFARSKLRSGVSRLRLRQQLFQRGIAPDVSAAAIDLVMEEEIIDPELPVERIARRKLATLAKLEVQARRQRLYRFLSQRGHAPDVVRRVVARLVP